MLKRTAAVNDSRRRECKRIFLNGLSFFDIAFDFLLFLERLADGKRGKEKRSQPEYEFNRLFHCQNSS